MVDLHGTPLSLAVIMDPIQSIQYKKDTTLALLWAAQDKGLVIHYLEISDLQLRGGRAWGRARPLVGPRAYSYGSGLAVSSGSSISGSASSSAWSSTRWRRL